MKYQLNPLYEGKISGELVDRTADSAAKSIYKLFGPAKHAYTPKQLKLLLMKKKDPEVREFRRQLANVYKNRKPSENIFTQYIFPDPGSGRKLTATERFGQIVNRNIPEV